jgi:NADPH:quinone reductase-like Zn-dependent oxidoreductase
MRLRNHTPFDQIEVNILQTRLRKIARQAKKQKTRRTSKKVAALVETKDETVVQISEVIRPTPLIRATPTLQRALVVARKGEYEIRDDYGVPELENEDEIMIRSCAVGLNPIDWKSVSYNFCLPQFPWVCLQPSLTQTCKLIIFQITGREMSGIVEKVGNNVTTFLPGDRVWTSTYYRDVRAGCFQEYVTVPQHTVLPIPSDLSFEQAACLGVAALTASMTLWKWLSVSLPHIDDKSPSSSSSSLDSGYQSRESMPRGIEEMEVDSDEWILIWGGSAVTGQWATQLAKLSGLKVMTVCSSKTAALSKRLGADHVVIRCGRTSQQLLDEISLVSRGRITTALDLVGPKTAALCLEVCSRKEQIEALGDRKIIFAPLAMMSASQEVPENVRVETVEMKRFVLDVDAGMYGVKLNQLLESGLLRLPDMHVLEGGLDDVQDGLDTLKRGDMGGKKVVVKMCS